MELCQLPAKADGAVLSENLRHALQGVHKLMGSFVEDHGPLLVYKRIQMLPAAFRGGGEKTLKAKSTGSLTGDAQGGDHGTGTGNGAHGNACVCALLYKLLAGVGDGGTSGVGYQRAGLPGKDPVQDHITLLRLVMLVVADKVFSDTKVV